MLYPSLLLHGCHVYFLNDHHISYSSCYKTQQRASFSYIVITFLCLVQMCSEMMQHRSYTQKVDVYSFGIVLWELVTGNIPFGRMSPVQAAAAVVRGVRPDIPPDCVPSLSRIMTSCWDANAEARPSFSEVVALLEDAQLGITNSVGTAKFRGCGCFLSPCTLD